jgi:hypothetical protein
MSGHSHRVLLLPFFVVLAVGAAAHSALAQDPFKPIPPPSSVQWSFKDSVTACPAGDTVLAGHPSRLRIVVRYFSGPSETPHIGVPPESIYVKVRTLAGNAAANDLSKDSGGDFVAYADDSTDATGQTRITVSSIRGTGQLQLLFVVSGSNVGSDTATVRTMDTDADSRVTISDRTSLADLTYSSAQDTSYVTAHLDHWNRNALHGSLVRRTNLCETCAAESTGTIGESEIFWSPDSKKVAFTIHVGTVANGEAPCAIFTVPSSPADGNTPTRFSFPDSGLHDYDPSWSPLGYEIVFDRDDRRLLRKGIPGLALDTAIALVSASGDINASGDATPGVSPDGKWVAFSRRDAGPRHIYKVPIGGGIPTQLTSESDGVDFYPQWSSDGIWITFDRQSGASDQPHHVYKVKASGDSLQAIFDPPTGKDAATPAYSPDNAIVLFGFGSHGGTIRDVSTRTLDPLSPIKPAILNYGDAAFSIVGPDPVLSPRLSVDGTRLGLRSKQIWAARRNMNLPPVISSVSGHTITHQTPYFDITQGQDTTLSLVVSRSDPAGDALTDNAFFLRPDFGMSWTSSTQTLGWPVGDSPVGSYTVRFATSDPSGGTDGALARILVRDITRPAVVSDLDATCDPDRENVWNLSWIATSDDSNYTSTGPATEYDIRTYGSPITTSNWNSADPIGGPTPGSPGGTDTWSIGVSGLTYLRMKVRDDNNNWSALSGQLTLHTVFCDGGGMFAGGGGGGGELRTAGAASLQVVGGIGASGANSENSLMDGVEVGSRGRDLLRMSECGGADGTYSLYLRESSGRSATVDAARLLLVDHAAGTEAFGNISGVVIGTRSLSVKATLGTGVDVASQTIAGGGGCYADSGQAVTVSTALDAAVTPVVIECNDAGAGSKPIIVEGSDGEGGWRPVGRIYPRARTSAAVVDSVPAGSFRLLFNGFAQVISVARLAPSVTALTTQWAHVDGASTGWLADARGALAGQDSLEVALGATDTLHLHFSASSPAIGQVRDAFLCIDATSSHTALGSQANQLAAVPAVPVRFALKQNQPNPFHRTTVVRFELPVGQLVQLEIFDSQGRRVRRLANSYLPAGYQALQWDQRDDSNRLVNPGIYFYRLHSQVFVGRKMMVVLP